MSFETTMIFQAVVLTIQAISFAIMMSALVWHGRKLSRWRDDVIDKIAELERGGDAIIEVGDDGTITTKCATCRRSIKRADATVEPPLNKWAKPSDYEARPDELPMQPLEIDAGKARFKQNTLVRFLLDAGPFDMNKLAIIRCSDAERSQFAQLIGYSIDGWGELDYVTDEERARAESLAPFARRQP